MRFSTKDKVRARGGGVGNSTYLTRGLGFRTFIFGNLIDFDGNLRWLARETAKWREIIPEKIGDSRKYPRSGVSGDTVAREMTER